MKINIKNTDKIEEALKTVQLRSKVRLLDVEDIVATCKQTVKSLKKMGMYRDDMVGAKLRFRNGYGSFPSSYNGVPEATHFEFEICKSGIFVTAIYRGGCEGLERVDFINQEQFKDAFAKRPLNLMAA